MKNTLENKCKFFAQYWGQTFVYTGTGRPMRNLPKRFVLNYESSDKIQLLLFSNNRAVELKPLSQISDEDAIWGAEQIFIKDFLDTNDEEVIIRKAKEHIDTAGFRFFRTIERIDRFRSKGFALPWNGITVDQQIEWGWVKLKEK